MGTTTETAKKLVEMLRDAGLAARFVGGLTERAGERLTRIWAGNTERDEEAVFEIKHDDVARVVCCPIRLGLYGKALRGRTVWASESRVLRARREQIAGYFREHALKCGAQKKAWAVSDELKQLGFLCMARDGRVVITLDLSPEYAAEVGLKIAAAMGERKNSGV
jgi:hypothetical protein